MPYILSVPSLAARACARTPRAAFLPDSWTDSHCSIKHAVSPILFTSYACVACMQGMGQPLMQTSTPTTTTCRAYASRLDAGNIFSIISPLWALTQTYFSDSLIYFSYHITSMGITSRFHVTSSTNTCVFSIHAPLAYFAPARRRWRGYFPTYVLACWHPR